MENDGLPTFSMPSCQTKYKRSQHFSVGRIHGNSKHYEAYWDKGKQNTDFSDGLDQFPIDIHSKFSNERRSNPDGSERKELSQLSGEDLTITPR